MKIIIGHLYPDLLNIYGDRGNIICLKKRSQWRNIEIKIINLSLNDQLNPNQCDLFFGGGGQDRQQAIIARDLQKKKSVLQQEADRGVPMLTICGSYQLFGHFFQTHKGKKIPGISIFNAYTVASYQRKIGNITIKANNQSLPFSCQLVGFENHSGNTFIKKAGPNKTLPLGKVIKGFGNNGRDKTAGAVFKNVIGSYLHGPILPKNPQLADFLISQALETKYQRKINLKPLDDQLEYQAQQKALKR